MVGPNFLGRGKWAPEGVRSHALHPLKAEIRKQRGWLCSETKTPDGLLLFLRIGGDQTFILTPMSLVHGGAVASLLSGGQLILVGEKH